MDPDLLDFISSPPDYLQLKCPICLELLLESPNLFSCCGNHVCGGCVGNLKEKACPMCKAIKYETLINKSHQRAITSLKIHCSNKEKGCKWTGEVKQLETHLSLTKGNCQYESYNCKHKCGSSHSRIALTSHENYSCTKRPIVCHFCKKYSSTFDEVTRVHHEVCSQYPVRCPNDCGASVKRIVLDTHVSTNCPQRKVQCEFVGIGCKWFDKERQLPKHLEENWREHIAFAMSVMSHSAKEVGELRHQVTELQERMTKLELESSMAKSESCSLPKKHLRSESEDSEEESDGEPVTKKCLPEAKPNVSLSSAGEAALKTTLDPSKMKCIITSFGYAIPFKIPDHSVITATLVVSRWHHKRAHNNLHKSRALSIPGHRHLLQVTVYCNGVMNARGSHVSVCANVYHGSSPSLPLFSGKLLVTLLSPIPEYEKKYGLIIFDDTVDDKYRRPSRDGVEIGIRQFVSSHSMNWIVI
ncbi:PREDICTED: TNF receptor-associated factor 2-like [Amphimedon queenslandica]|nr:PREDICTED: TNF receptor-associated factor 2-like [Amphimedon queenslandica]|eukprot:XP_011403170.1 PREDICTED: TNF receptor-associated factor 2-like [Amphimedon queenslandica]